MAAQKPYKAIMLIDDNEIDNLINQKIIEASNICDYIFTHTGGKSAIEFLRNIEKIAPITCNKGLPELIFLDIDMPLMDGFQYNKQYLVWHNICLTIITFYLKIFNQKKLFL